MRKARCPHCHQIYSPQPGDARREAGTKGAANTDMAALGRKGGRPRHQRYSPRGEAARPAGNATEGTEVTS